MNESAITGESAPVIREAGGDRSAVTGGTTVLSDRIVVEVTSEPGQTFLDRMIRLVEGAERQKTPNEIALDILLAGLTIVFLFATVTLRPFAVYSGGNVSVTVLIALLVCLIPTTIGGLLSAIGIAGMDRVLKHNILAMSGRAVEAAGDVNVLLLDKTGTITLGNREAVNFVPARAFRKRSWPSWLNSPRSPTRLPRVGPSSSWRRRSTTFERVSCESSTRNSSRSPPEPGCPASTSKAGERRGRAQPTWSTRSSAAWAGRFRSR